MTKKLRALAPILFLACGYLAAQSVSSHPTLLANVLDRNGQPVRDLTRDNFQVKVNGHRATQLEATYSLAPRRIVVLLDMSGSMAGDGDHKKWMIAIEAVEDLLADTPVNASLALVTFSDHVHDIFDFTQSRTSMARWLREGANRQGDSRIHGTTAIFDALLAATKIFNAPHSGDAIYLISDGGDNSSHTRSKEIRELLLRSEIRLFVFLFVDPVPFENVRLGTEAIKEIARTTGGFVFGIPGHAGVVSFLPSWNSAYNYDEHARGIIKLYTQALNLQVNGFYTLRFNLPVAHGKARKVSLDVVDARGKPRKDVAFTYSTLLPQPDL